MLRKSLKILQHLVIFVLLTVVTQIGGIVYLISVSLVKRSAEKKKLKRFVIFTVLYLFTTFIIVPYLAPVFGREKINETEYLKARSIFFILTNRNYVKPELNKTIEQIAFDFGKQNNGIKMIFLDANFPFIDKFPLFPHLSHNDGKKIDVSFIYENSDGKMTNSKPSISGYGVYEMPKENEFDQNANCKQKGFWQYDFPKYLTFGTINRNLKLSERGTRNLVVLIVENEEIGKLFIEPHLKTRLNLTYDKVRFHGCYAVRHDDHIHFQLK